jgi:DNA-binding response OmpR family regulator
MEKILIIEDEPDIATTIKYALEQEEYWVAVAHSGEKGLEKAMRENPDLVILDLKLPNLPGEEVCRQLRKNEKTENMPIIMLTAKDLEVDKIIGKVIGADFYMTKPFDVEELLGKIRGIFKERQGRSRFP